MRFRTGPGVLAVVVVAMTAVLAGCGAASQRVVSPSAGGPSPSPTTTTSATATSDRVPGPDKHVWVEGDSVLLGTTVTMPEALRGWTVHLDTVGSRRLTEAIPVLRANRRQLGSVVAIQMGNNYITGEDGSFATQLKTAMHIMHNVERVVWVTVAAASPSQVRINRVIMNAARRYPTIRVADWAPMIAAHPSYAYDGLHLTPSGRVAMARLVARAIGPAPGESEQAFHRHLHKVSFAY